MNIGELIGSIIGSSIGSYASMSGPNVPPVVLPTSSPNTAQPEDKMQQLQDKLDRLVLITMAMWELTKEKGFTDEELAKKIQEIDLLDGKLDGKTRSQKKGMLTCVQCGRVMSKRHSRCLFCGNQDLQAEPFDPLR